MLETSNSDWPVFSLGELAAEENGSISIGPFGSSLKAELYTSSGIPVVRGNNLGFGQGFHGTFVYIDDSTAAKFPKCLVYPGDLVFPHRGAIGEVGLAVGPSGTRWFLSTSMMKFRPNKTKLDAYFLYYFFKSDNGRHQLLRNASQVGTPGIGQPLASLRSCEIKIPSLADQQKISQTLSALDEKIDSNRRTNQVLEQMARAIFRSWFVDFEPVKAKATGARFFPSMPQKVFDTLPTSFVESELGLIPEGWEVKSLEALAAIRGGKQLPTKDCLPNGDFKVFGANGVMGFAKKPTHNGFVIAFGRVGAYCGSIHWSFDGAWINNNASSVVPIRWPEYVLQAMLNFDFHSMRRGSAQPFIPNSSLGATSVLNPRAEVGDAFCDIVGTLRRLQAAAELQSHSLVIQRDYLLPKLLSGEVRVSEIEGTIR